MIGGGAGVGEFGLMGTGPRLTRAETVTMRNQRRSRTARQVIALSLVLACLTGQSGVGAEQSAGTHFTHTLYLVRHGAYDTTARADPEIGPGLTPLGIAQARLVAARLRGLPVHLDSMTRSTESRRVIPRL